MPGSVLLVCLTALALTARVCRCLHHSRISGVCVSATLALRSAGSRRSVTDCYLSLEQQQAPAGLWLAQFNAASGSCYQFQYQSVCHLLWQPSGSGCEAILSSQLDLQSVWAHYSAVWEAAGSAMDSLVCGQAALDAVAVQWTGDGALLYSSTASVLQASSVQNLTHQTALTWLVRASRTSGTRCFLEFNSLGANLWEFSELNSVKERRLLSRLSPSLRIESLQQVLPTDATRMVTVGVAYSGPTGQLKLFIGDRFLRPDEVNIQGAVPTVVDLKPQLSIGQRSSTSGWLAGTVQVVALSMKYLSEEEIRQLFIN